MVHGTLIPHHQTPIVIHPPEAAFHLPAVAVVGARANRPPAFGKPPGPPGERWNSGLNTSAVQIAAELPAIISFIRHELLWARPRAASRSRHARWPSWSPPAGFRVAGHCPHTSRLADRGHRRRPSPSSPCRFWSCRRRSPLFRRDEAAVQECLRPFQPATGIELAQQRPPEPLPGAIVGPGAEPAPARGWRAIYARHIFPRAARLQHEEDAVERAAIVVPPPARARFLLREEGLDDGPLLICQIMSAHAHNVPWAASILK
jgi:hypothetical protein